MRLNSCTWPLTRRLWPSFASCLPKPSTRRAGLRSAATGPAVRPRRPRPWARPAPAVRGGAPVTRPGAAAAASPPKAGPLGWPRTSPGRSGPSGRPRAGGAARQAVNSSCLARSRATGSARRTRILTLPNRDRSGPVDQAAGVRCVQGFGGNGYSRAKAGNPLMTPEKGAFRLVCPGATVMGHGRMALILDVVSLAWRVRHLQRKRTFCIPLALWKGANAAAPKNTQSLGPPGAD